MFSKPSLEPVQGACTCGRRLTDATVFTYRSRTHLHDFYLCACGFEWTQSRELFDLAEPVSSDEVIEVHRQLAELTGTLAELLAPKT